MKTDVRKPIEERSKLRACLCVAFLALALLGFVQALNSSYDAGLRAGQAQAYQSSYEQGYNQGYASAAYDIEGATK